MVWGETVERKGTKQKKKKRSSGWEQSSPVLSLTLRFVPPLRPKSLPHTHIHTTMPALAVRASLSRPAAAGKTGKMGRENWERSGEREGRRAR